MHIINPATAEIITELTEDNQVSVAKKFQLLKEGQKRWKNVPLGERIKVLQKFSSLLEADIESLAAVLTSEVGKPLQQWSKGAHPMVDIPCREILGG